MTTTAKEPQVLQARAHATTGHDLSRTLELRMNAPTEAEASEAASTHDDTVQVPWPIPASKLIDFYLSNPWLGAVGNLLADAVSAATWELDARDVDTLGNSLERDDSWDKQSDEGYNRARAWLSRETLGREGVTDLDLPGLLRALSVAADQTGNVFTEVLRDRAGREPVAVSHLLPQFVWYRAHQGQLSLYQMDPYRGEFNFIPFGTRKASDKEEREYIHQRTTNTVSSYYGLPAWLPARDSIDVDNEHRKYLRGFFKNHGTPRYLVTITQDPAWTGAQPGEDALNELFQHVTSFLSANAGDMAGRNLVLQYPGGITVEATPLDHKLEDPTFPNTAKLARDEILAVRHVSLLNLGLPEGGYRATAEQQSKDFQEQVLRPFAAPAVAIINRILHAPEPHGLGVQDYDFALSWEDADAYLAKIEALVTAVGGPVLSQSEARQELGYEAAGETAPFIPTSMLPGGDLGVGGPDGQAEE